ncbi:MAG: ankyrin repeat domain-containing protein [Bacteroidota bacterium]
MISREKITKGIVWKFKNKIDYKKIKISEDGPLSLLMCIVEYGYKDIVELLLESGANPNLKYHHGHKALDYASHVKYKPEVAQKVIHLLVDKGIAMQPDKDMYYMLLEAVI